MMIQALDGQPLNKSHKEFSLVVIIRSLKRGLMRNTVDYNGTYYTVSKQTSQLSHWTSNCAGLVVSISDFCSDHPSLILAG